MGKARLLVVEDDIDVGHLLKYYFSSIGYDVDLAIDGLDALEKVRQALPNVVILDIMLPNVDGYDVCRSLRTNIQTSHIPVIFITQKEERADKLQGLELGADDYIIKPFDIEELKLRVQGVLRRSEHEKLTDPRSGLPTGWLIQEQLLSVIREKDLALLDARINNFGAFSTVYGFVAGEDVLRFAAMMIDEVVDELGNISDFIGHAGEDNFIIITNKKKADKIKSRLKERFNIEVQAHYNFIDRQQGFIEVTALDGTASEAPFMTMSIGIVSSSERSFSDIREITVVASEERRQDLITEHIIDERLRYFSQQKDWAYLELHIKHFEAYQEVYGFSESDHVIWFIIKIIREAINELRLIDGFIGHSTKGKFVIIVSKKSTRAFCKIIKSQFDANILSCYHYIHRVNGYIRPNDHKRHPFMKLTIGAITPAHPSFADIRKIIEFEGKFDL